MRRFARRTALWPTAAALALSVLAAEPRAEVPLEMNVQGRLLGSAGEPLAGPANLTIRIYDAMTAGALVYQEDHAATPLDAGVFELVLGAGSAPIGTLDASTFGGPNRFLELLVDGAVLEPRQPFRSVPYAFRVPGPLECTLETNVGTFSAGSSFALDAICPDIEQGMVSGGFEWTGASSDVWITESSPGNFLNAWTVRGNNLSTQSVEVTAWVRCCRQP